MCNDYRRRKAYRDYVLGLERHGQMTLEFPPLHAAPNLEPQDDVWPSNPAPIFRRRTDGALEMAILRWGLIPWFHKGTVKDFTSKFATFNAKGEELVKKPTWREAFKGRRCLIPADGWYEFKGDRAPKSKFLFTPRGEEWLCFAGLWDHAETAGGTVESFTMVTQAPGPAMRPYHHRAPAVLRDSEWATWLDLTADVAPILARESEDRFDVEQVR